jgi:predicted transcriptional regulator
MEKDLRDTVFEALEIVLEAQLRAVRRVRKGQPPDTAKPVRRARSQVDMAYDILKKARKPLHVTELLDRLNAAFRVHVDRESLVSSLTKKVARGDRFVRTGKNTFGLKEDPP